MNHEPNPPTETGDVMPESTYAPVAMAMAISMTAWGILTHWTMSVAGACLFSWALYQWMCQVYGQWRQEDE